MATRITAVIHRGVTASAPAQHPGSGVPTRLIRVQRPRTPKSNLALVPFACGPRTKQAQLGNTQGDARLQKLVVNSEAVVHGVTTPCHDQASRELLRDPGQLDTLLPDCSRVTRTYRSCHRNGFRSRPGLRRKSSNSVRASDQFARVPSITRPAKSFSVRTASGCIAGRMTARAEWLVRSNSNSSPSVETALHCRRRDSLLDLQLSNRMSRILGLLAQLGKPAIGLTLRGRRLGAQLGNDDWNLWNHLLCRPDLVAKALETPLDADFTAKHGQLAFQQLDRTGLLVEFDARPVR